MRDGRVSISVKLPLAIDRGTLTQHSVQGYDARGDYRVVHDDLDLSVTDRHQMLQLDFHEPLLPGVSWFASLAVHKNWGNKAALENRMLFAGLVAKL